MLAVIGRKNEEDAINREQMKRRIDARLRTRSGGEPDQRCDRYPADDDDHLRRGHVSVAEAEMQEQNSAEVNEMRRNESVEERRLARHSREPAAETRRSEPGQKQCDGKSGGDPRCR